MARTAARGSGFSRSDSRRSPAATRLRWSPAALASGDAGRVDQDCQRPQPLDPSRRQLPDLSLLGGVAGDGNGPADRRLDVGLRPPCYGSFTSKTLTAAHSSASSRALAPALSRTGSGDEATCPSSFLDILPALAAPPSSAAVEDRGALLRESPGRLPRTLRRSC
jgi:hypothetical protein